MPEKFIPSSFFLKTGQTYIRREYSSEVNDLFPLSILGNLNDVKQVILTSPTAPAPWVCTVSNGNTNAWQYFKGHAVDIAFGSTNKNHAYVVITFTFSGLWASPYQWGILSGSENDIGNT